MSQLKNNRVFLPLKKDIMHWLKEFENIGFQDEYNEQVNKCKSMLSEDYTEPVGRYASQKECYDDYYRNGFSTIEIGKLFKVSKQYVDAMLAYKYDTELRNTNIDNRSEVSDLFNYLLYVKVPDKYGLDKLKDFGIKSTEYTLRNKYHNFGGVKLDTVKNMRHKEKLIFARKVYDDYLDGMTLRDISEKYNRGVGTISNYIKLIKKHEESVK